MTLILLGGEYDGWPRLGELRAWKDVGWLQGVSFLALQTGGATQPKRQPNLRHSRRRTNRFPALERDRRGGLPKRGPSPLPPVEEYGRL